MWRVNLIMDNELFDFKPLQEIVEREQGLKTIIQQTGDNISIKPINDVVINNRFLQITFRIYRETLILSWLYLLYEGRGTGTKIIEWFIKYCSKNNNINILKIVNVQKDKTQMRQLCIKFNFVENKSNDDFSDFLKSFTE